jgi:hypothetical protein
MLVNKNVQSTNKTIHQKDINSQLKYIISQTKAQSFTSIFTSNRMYNMLYVSKKYDIQSTKYEDVKDKIFNVVMEQREKEYLKNYFETLKITADIKVLR